MIPGPIIYADNIDSIIVANTNLEIECYRYQSMQVSTNNNLD